MSANAWSLDFELAFFLCSRCQPEPRVVLLKHLTQYPSPQLRLGERIDSILGGGQGRLNDTPWIDIPIDKLPLTFRRFERKDV